MDRISLIIVDDHEMVRQGIRGFVETQNDLVILGEAGSGTEAVELVRDHAPDVVLMDLIMPGMDGVEATRRVKAMSPRTAVIVLTSYHDDEHIFPAIRAGALSYLLKDIAATDLVAAVRKAAGGEAVLHPHVARRLVQEVHGAANGTSDPFTDLTARELDVLRNIAAGSNNAEIAEQLFISPKTVKSHVSNILSKLHLSDRTQAAVMAWREGMVQRGDEVNEET